MDFDIPCPVSLKRAIVKSIYDAIEQDVAVERSHRNYPYYNQPWVAMWNHMGANLIEAITNDDVVIITAKRGPWSFILIYFETEKTIITIMSEDRLATLQRQYRNRPMHYLDILIQRYNRDIEPLQTRLDIPDMEQFEEDEIDLVLSKICPQIKEQAEKHLLITFDRKNDSLISVKAKRLAAIDMSEVATEDWTAYIDVSYAAVDDTGKVVQPVDKEINIPLTKTGLNIKKKKEGKHLDGVIEPKKEKEEDKPKK
jgi:hypothetical protein